MFSTWERRAPAAPLINPIFDLRSRRSKNLSPSLLEGTRDGCHLGEPVGRRPVLRYPAPPPRRAPPTTGPMAIFDPIFGSEIQNRRSSSIFGPEDRRCGVPRSSDPKIEDAGVFDLRLRTTKVRGSSIFGFEDRRWGVDHRGRGRSSFLIADQWTDSCLPMLTLFMQGMSAMEKVVPKIIPHSRTRLA